MIIIASPGKPFQYTAKGTARRQAVIKDYEAEIDTLYSAVDDTAQTPVSYPDQWTAPIVLQYIREVVRHVLRTDALGDDQDIFQNGCDRYVIDKVVDLT